MPFCIVFPQKNDERSSAFDRNSNKCNPDLQSFFWALSHNWAKSFQFTTPKCESLNITRTYSSEWGSLDFTAHEVSFSFCRKENVLIIFTRCSPDVKKKKKKGWDSESHTNVLLKNWFHAKKKVGDKDFTFFFSPLCVCTLVLRAATCSLFSFHA